MANFNYKKTCSKILEPLSLKQKEIILRRFGLGAKKETLESIGRSLGITRERVRQIEQASFLNLKPEIKKQQKVFKYFKDYLGKRGNLKKEDLLLDELGGKKFQREIYFLLNLGEDFERLGETKDFYSLWTTDLKFWTLAWETVNSLHSKLNEINKPLKLKEVNDLFSFSPEALISYLEVSKKIQRNSEGFYGIKEWPEINPRRIKDKAYLIFKKEQKPLHFSNVAQFIGLPYSQTVHNELIKDPRFVLIGRGTYALREWGYEDGTVKDVISKILKNTNKPLSREEILKKTLEKRMVKENTVFLNLGNKKYFLKNTEGRYTTREA